MLPNYDKCPLNKLSTLLIPIVALTLLLVIRTKFLTAKPQRQTVETGVYLNSLKMSPQGPELDCNIISPFEERQRSAEPGLGPQEDETGVQVGGNCLASCLVGVLKVREVSPISITMMFCRLSASPWFSMRYTLVP